MRNIETLLDLLELQADRRAQMGYTFLADSGTSTLTYADLRRRAEALAAQLQARYQPGDRALLAYAPGLEFLVGLFGSLLAGMVAVPAYPPRARRADVRLESIVNNCTPSVVLVTSDLVQDRERLTSHNPHLTAVDWLASDITDNATQWTRPDVQGNDLAVLQYTSGSTGTPRGVMLSHANILTNVQAIASAMKLDEDIVGVSWLPTFHDMGLIGNLLEVLWLGSRLVMLPPASFVQRPLRWLQAISDHQGTVSGAPCFAYDLCINRISDAEAAHLDLSAWQVAYVGAEPINPRVLDRFADKFARSGFRRTSLYPCYGLAEATLIVTGATARAIPTPHIFNTNSLEQNVARHDTHGRPLVSSGRAVAGTTVQITDPSTLAPLEQGRIGEVWVRGPSVAQGYWQQPDATAFHNAGEFLRTGDLGFVEHGELYITGRLKELLIIRGRNYYPQDIEAAVTLGVPELASMPGAAYSIETDAGSRLGLVFEVPRGTKPDTYSQLAGAIRCVVASEFELELADLQLVKFGSIPRTSSGKIRRQECATLAQRGELEVVHRVQPSEPTEANTPQPQAVTEQQLRDWLIARLARHAGIPANRVDIDQPFAAFGLDSLTMVTVASELETLLGTALPATLLYDAPTVAGLARHLCRETTPAEPNAPAAHLDCAIAVVGIGCRFPQAHGPAAFWDLLSHGRSGISELPAGRWKSHPSNVATTRAGWLDDVYEFDAGFFGVTPREATYIDPQQRLLLETTWEALEHAGIPGESIAGREVGVFVGVSGGEYGRLLVQHTGHADAYLGIGNAPSMAANRLSFHLDLQGPSVSVDSACSSSLLAVHLACQSLRLGECETALVGGVNLILSPELTESFSRAQMLSPTGACHTFDSQADGYVRGEGCGVVVLKTLVAAQAAGDRVLAIIEATATRQDGRSNGITAPNGTAQAELIRKSLALAHRQPGDITCIEAHGTGTPLGDPIEFNALQQALGSAGTPCYLSTVKSNIGHLEAAAGIAGFIKAVLQLQHGQIVPHLNYRTTNPHIALAASRFAIPQQLATWPLQQPRVIGVSAFGFGGTNVHAILSAAPARQHTPVAGPKVFALSAKSDQSLRNLVQRYIDFLPTTSNTFLEVCQATARHRTHHAHRVAVAGESVPNAVQALRQWLAAEHSQTESPRVAFVFTGQGSQYVNMARELYDANPTFRQHFQECVEIVREVSGLALLDVLADATRINDTAIAQPALFAVEYALAKLWQEYGLAPVAVLGHSVGEYAAACVAGVLSLEDGIRLITERGRLMQACPAGAMLACFTSYDRAENIAFNVGSDVCVAVINGPENVVLSGTIPGIEQAQTLCAQAGIVTRRLRTERAFHSPLIDGALSELDRVAFAMKHHKSQVPFISNLTGEAYDLADDPTYWSRHARGVVQFSRGVATLYDMGVTHFLEIGPDAVLCQLGRSCQPNSGKWLPSLRRGQSDTNTLAHTLANLYSAGASIAWNKVFMGTAHLDLPLYPFQHSSYRAEDAPKLEQADPLVVTEPASLDWKMASRWDQELPRRSAPFSGLSVLLPRVQQSVESRHDIASFDRMRVPFDRLAGLYVRDTLARLGWHPTPGATLTIPQLSHLLEVLPQYRRLLARLIGMAAEDGWLTLNGERITVTRQPDTSDTSQMLATLLQEYPDFSAALTLANRCATRMAGVMRGSDQALDVLFGDEAAELTEAMYERSPVARFYNELLSCAVQAIVAQLPTDRPLRVLELGAGTGGTTSYVLPHLPTDRTEYVYSDVSPLFLAQAKEKFARYPFVQFSTLDLEQSAAALGFAAGQFDLILAANVLHATANIRHSVQFARDLLAPGGVLVLLEGAGRRRLLDLIFGLTEGWWKFTDPDIRQDYPLLSANTWRQLLENQQFCDISILAPRTSDHDPDQLVIVAQRQPHAAEPAIAPGSLAELWAQQPSREQVRFVTTVAEWDNRRTDAKVTVLVGATLTQPPATRTGNGLICFDSSTPIEWQVRQLQAELAHPGIEPVVLFQADQRYTLRGESAVAKPVVAVTIPALSAIYSMNQNEQYRAVRDYLQGEVNRVAGLSLTGNDLERPLQSFGLDSLLAMQFRNRVESNLGVALSLVDFLRGVSINQLAERVLVQLNTRTTTPETAAVNLPVPSTVVSSHVQDLSERELDSLLQSLLDGESRSA